MSTPSRKDILARLRTKVAEGKPIIGGGAGTGISAKFEEVGGIDLIVIYNSGRFRMAGRGSCAGLMPYGDANAIVLEMAAEVLPVIKHTPVLAGVCGTDPFRQMDSFLRRVKEAGFAGVQNFPTVGVIDGGFRQTLEETGMSFALEVEMIRRARELDLLTTPYVFDVEQARAMAEAGADIIIPHMKTTTKGSIGVKTAPSLEEAAQRVQELADAAKQINPDVLVLCHGGPIADPEDAQYIFDHTHGIVGFYGASSIERLPVELAITQRVREFGRLRIGEAAGPGGKAKRFVTQREAQVEELPHCRIEWLCRPGLVDTGNLLLARATMPAGQSRAFHKHPGSEEIIYIVEGQAEQWIETECQILGPGEVAHIPKGVVHATHNRSNYPLIFLAVFSPASPSPECVDVSGEKPWSSLRRTAKPSKQKPSK